MTRLKHLIFIPIEFPPGLPNKTNKVLYKVSFTPESRYDVGIEQGDWNKLTGLKFNFFKPKENSMMIAWRYYEGKFHLAPYTHINDVFNPNLPYVTLIEHNEYYVQVENNDGVLTASCYFILDDREITMFSYTFDFGIKKDTWEIQSWFGGTKLPPKMINFLKRKINN